VFLLALAHTVPGAAQVVGTLLVLRLVITPGAVATDGGLLVSFEVGNVKARVFITSISFAIYLLTRLVGPALRDPALRPPPGQVDAPTVNGRTSWPSAVGPRARLSMTSWVPAGPAYVVMT